MRMTFYVLLGMTLGWYCWNALLAWVLALALSYAALVAYELLRGPVQRPALRRAMARLLASGVLALGVDGILAYVGEYGPV